MKDSSTEKEFKQRKKIENLWNEAAIRAKATLTLNHNIILVSLKVKSEDHEMKVFWSLI